MMFLVKGHFGFAGLCPCFRLSPLSMALQWKPYISSCLLQTQVTTRHQCFQEISILEACPLFCSVLDSYVLLFSIVFTRLHQCFCFHSCFVLPRHVSLFPVALLLNRGNVLCAWASCSRSVFASSFALCLVPAT